jgi:SAM-dependent methyltransferase
MPIQRLSDFECDERSGVYVPSKRCGGQVEQFAYTDGDSTEKYLLDAMVSRGDLSYDSEELFQVIRDWPSYYHFGPGRANIFRVLDLPARSKVLELGSGCGAITRYLGEKFESVDCIEGSFVRARIGRTRCRDLRNVRVFCSNIENAALEQAYDIVTLIGVWEYAPVYMGQPGKDACMALLESAKSGLRRDGVLVIAIENKIGLKYWTGSREDHTSRLYDSIHGYPRGKSAVTFSRREIAGYLHRAGFSHVHFYHCFPDYKFATTVFSGSGQDDEAYLHNWVGVPFQTGNGTRDYNIHEGLALRTLSRAGLLREFANSLVIVASQNDVCPALAPDWIAKKVSGYPRRREYQCITTLKTAPERHIEKVRVYAEKAEGVSGQIGEAIGHDASKATWHAGDIMLFDVYEALFHDDFRDRVKPMLQMLYEEAIRRFSSGRKDDAGYPLLQPNAVDFMFRNIVRGASGLEYIDPEWTASAEIPVDYLLFRCIMHDILGAQYPGIRTNTGNHEEFTIGLIQEFFPGYTNERHCGNKSRERAFLDLTRIGVDLSKASGLGNDASRGRVTAAGLLRRISHVLPESIRLKLRRRLKNYL